MKRLNRDWHQIQAAQQGSRLDRPVQHQDDIAKYRAADRALLEMYGSIRVLRNLGYHGVVDRLERSGS